MQEVFAASGQSKVVRSRANRSFRTKDGEDSKPGPDAAVDADTVAAGVKGGSEAPQSWPRAKGKRQKARASREKPLETESENTKVWYDAFSCSPAAISSNCVDFYMRARFGSSRLRQFGASVESLLCEKLEMQIAKGCRFVGIGKRSHERQTRRKIMTIRSVTGVVMMSFVGVDTIAISSSWDGRWLAWFDLKVVVGGPLNLMADELQA
ncbi:hypothetical protein BDZ45DRAFT_676124 [Acephala macrosclerotiorum]|nr:hypothetical protein BDZ45DRAFT_676124 [Acephala macrosclerotiorum]